MTIEIKKCNECIFCEESENPLGTYCKLQNNLDNTKQCYLSNNHNYLKQPEMPPDWCPLRKESVIFCI